MGEGGVKERKNLKKTRFGNALLAWQRGGERCRFCMDSGECGVTLA